MILKKVMWFLFIALSVSSTSLLAQSDYEKVEAFKKEVEHIKLKISNADSLGECKALSDSITILHDKYVSEKELLDKSIYPGDFESTIGQLEDALKLRSSDFSVITDLTEEVSSMKGQIEDLTRQNTSLIDRITELTEKSQKDAAEIANLQQLVAQLKSNIKKRDLLVRSMIDSLLTEFVRSPTTLDEAEKHNMMGEIENKSLFYNIERVIADNVSYIEVTEMKVPDLSEMLDEYTAFSKSWKQLGERMGDVYLDRKERTKEIAYIDGLFSNWQKVLNAKIWSSINQEFMDKGIKLLAFNNGEEFTSSVITFINTEMDNIPLKETDELQKTHDKFVYEVYLQSVQPEWIPFLINQKMMDESQRDTIQAELVSWKEALYPGPNLTWLYIIIALIIIIQGVVYFSRRKGESKFSWKKNKEEEE